MLSRGFPASLAMFSVGAIAATWMCSPRPICLKSSCLIWMFVPSRAYSIMASLESTSRWTGQLVAFRDWFKVIQRDLLELKAAL